VTGHLVLDHFAGTGWGVACQWLGTPEKGVEIMKEAVATREAVGFETVYRDVWDGLFDKSLVPDHDTYLASPPCQTFSVAGRGEGRKALDQVLDVIASEAWRYPELMKDLGGDLGDERTGLVLTPLAHIWEHRPTYIALEQVPTVLPVWEAIAKVLREMMGYSVWVGNLQAEMYGVPQTRKRAILIARKDGNDARPPRPTHSRYYSRDPKRLDPGVKKWVSMAEALGWEWGFTDRPAMTVTGHGLLTRQATGQQSAVAEAIEGGAFLPRPPFSRETMVRDTAELNERIVSLRLSSQEFNPRRLVSNYSDGGNSSTRGERTIDRPASTLTSKAGSSRWDGERNMKISEATTLQSYPSPFPFQGARGKQFLQVGNAVPPLLAEAILKGVWS
jgi:DNA (cytosine-5)-methyltransferase 1